MCKHKDKLQVVLDAAIKVEERPGVKSRKVIKAAMHLLRALLTSLVTFRPKESRSVPADQWNDALWRRTHYTSWGHVASLSKVSLEWRGPSEVGVQWAADLQAKYLEEPVTLLKSFLKQESDRRDGAGGTPKAGNSNNSNICSPVAHPDPADDSSSGAQAGAPGMSSSSSSRLAPPEPLVISPQQLTSAPETPTQADGSSGVISAIDATAAVVQIRMVTQGLVYVQRPWKDTEVDEASEVVGNEGDHCSFKAALSGLTQDCTGDLVVLPRPSEGLATHSRQDIAQLMHEMTISVLARRGEDVKLLQALTKAMDAILNGVDVLQKHLNRLRIRYTLIKSQFKEKEGVHKLMPRCMMVARLQHHQMTILMQRQRKMPSNPIINSLLAHMTELSTYHYRSVRVKAQPALISCTRRYQHACARIVPALVAMLEDTSNSGHAYEQKVVGAANLLQTGVISKRILRDWGMLRRFLLALCKSDHLDKVAGVCVCVCLCVCVCVRVCMACYSGIQFRAAPPS